MKRGLMFVAITTVLFLIQTQTTSQPVNSVANVAGLSSHAIFKVRVTAYRSVSNQTDDSPFITSIGHRTSQEGVAVSPDLLKSRSACYGDVVIIPGVGTRIINDVMALRHRRSFDVWVSTLSDEKNFGVKRLDIQVIKSPNRYCKKGD